MDDRNIRLILYEKPWMKADMSQKFAGSLHSEHIQQRILPIDISNEIVIFFLVE